LGTAVVRHVHISVFLNHEQPSFRLPSRLFSSTDDSLGGAGSHGPSSLLCYPGGGVPGTAPTTSAGGAATGARVTTRTSRQFLLLDSGRVSMISTVSPTCDSFCSS